jgi:hypothetical protein
MLILLILILAGVAAMYLVGALAGLDQLFEFLQLP